MVSTGTLSSAGGLLGGGGRVSFTDTFAQLDVEFPVPNNLDIDCIAVGSALIWHPGTICWPVFFFFFGGGGVGWGCQSWVCL